MTEFAEGGYVDKSDDIIISKRCDYYIPLEFAKKWAQGLLDKINQGVLQSDVEVADEDSDSEEDL